jgi:hypothetical protein
MAPPAIAATIIGTTFEPALLDIFNPKEGFM